MIFKPSDFTAAHTIDEELNGTTIKRFIINPTAAAANIANKLFNEWIAKQPVVYSKSNDARLWLKEKLDVEINNNGLKLTPDTHRARLVCIEPIVTEHECKPSDGVRGNISACEICGAVLKAKWERVK